MFPSSSLVTRVSQITAAKISAYKADRLGKKSERTERSLPAAAVNRPLALLRCLLRLAVEEWEVLFLVPKIRLEKEPQGRIGWLEDYEEVRLLDACGESLKNVLAVHRDRGHCYLRAHRQRSFPPWRPSP